MARTSEEERRNPGVLVVRPVQPLTGVEEREALMHPSPSMTAMGGQDDAVARSARLASSARCNGFCPPTALSSTRCASAGSSRSALRREPPTPSFQAAVRQTWTGRQPDSRARLKPEGTRGQAGKAVRPC
jgi:hypothetical protein